MFDDAENENTFSNMTSEGIDPGASEWIDRIFGAGISDAINNNSFLSLFSSTYEPTSIVTAVTSMNNTLLYIVSFLALIMMFFYLVKAAKAPRTDEFKHSWAYYIRIVFAMILATPVASMGITVGQAAVLSLAGLGASAAQYTWNGVEATTNNDVTAANRKINSEYIVKEMFLALVCAESFKQYGTRFNEGGMRHYPEHTTWSNIKRYNDKSDDNYFMWYGEDEGRCGSTVINEIGIAENENESNEYKDLNVRSLHVLKNTLYPLVEQFVKLDRERMTAFESKNRTENDDYVQYFDSVAQNLRGIIDQFEQEYQEAYKEITLSKIDQNENGSAASGIIISDNLSAIEDSFIYAGTHFKKISESHASAANSIRALNNSTSFKMPVAKESVSFMSAIKGQGINDTELIAQQVNDINHAKQLWSNMISNESKSTTQDTSEAIDRDRSTLDNADFNAWNLATDFKTEVSKLNQIIQNSVFKDVKQQIDDRTNAMQIIVGVGDNISTAGQMSFWVGSLATALPGSFGSKIMMISLSLEGLGAYMQIIIPNMMMIIWVGAIMAWLVSVAIAFIAVLFIPVALAIPSDEDGLFTNQYVRSGLMILVRVIATPWLLVVGLFIALKLSEIAFFIFTSMFFVHSISTSSLVLTLTLIAFFVYSTNMIYINAMQITARLPSMVIEYFAPGAADSRSESDSQSSREAESKVGAGVQTANAGSGLGGGGLLKGAAGAAGKALNATKSGATSASSSMSKGHMS